MAALWPREGWELAVFLGCEGVCGEAGTDPGEGLASKAWECQEVCWVDHVSTDL